MVDSLKWLAKQFSTYYCFPYDGEKCDVSIPLASLILVFGTLFIALQIYNFRFSRYLSSARREFVADYALAIAVLVMSFVGSYGFSGINLATFKDESEHKTPFYFGGLVFSAKGDKEAFSGGAVGVCLGLGFIMSILFFVEGNVAMSMVNNPHNRLQSTTFKRTFKPATFI